MGIDTRMPGFGAVRTNRGLVTIVTAAVCLIAGGVVVGVTVPAGAQVSCVDSAADAVTAHRVASACGKRVEALNGRTETAQVFANPSGDYTFESTLKPTRVHRPDGSWVAADATLRRNADGTVSPVAATLPITFSGGGTTPIARIAKGSQELTLGSLAGLPLPVPALSGTTATYVDVLPGVDLTLTADVDGFAEVLVVKTRDAARNPRLRRLTFRTSAKGLSLKVDPSTGAVGAVDAKGALVF